MEWLLACLLDWLNNWELDQFLHCSRNCKHKDVKFMQINKTHETLWDKLTVLSAGRPAPLPEAHARIYTPKKPQEIPWSMIFPSQPWIPISSTFKSRPRQRLSVKTATLFIVVLRGRQMDVLRINTFFHYASRQMLSRTDSRSDLMAPTSSSVNITWERSSCRGCTDG